MEEFLSSGMVAVILGGLITYLTQKMRKYKFSPRYFAVGISIVVGAIYVFFKNFISPETQAQFIMWITAIYGSSTAIYNIIVKPITDKYES